MPRPISSVLSAAACTALAVLFPGRAATRPPSSHALQHAFQLLHAARFIDLTHAFGPGSPHWKGMPDERVRRPFTIGKDGFNIDIFTHAGQWGTHVDPPSHFHDELKSVDEIDPKDFLLRLVIIDIHRQVAGNPDYTVTLKDVRAWEKRHGPVPRGAFVALRSDWSKRWPSYRAMQNQDASGTAHYPGWSLPVLRYLYEVRHISASGHETTDTDPGIATTRDDYSLESYVLGTNHFQIELLANLDSVPEAGALVMVTFPKPRGGSGFPARVVAIAPQ